MVNYVTYIVRIMYDKNVAISLMNVIDGKTNSHVKIIYTIPR